MFEQRLRLDAAAREQHEEEFPVPVARPARPHGLPLLRQAVAVQRTQQGDPARRTIFVPPLLVVVFSACDGRRSTALRGGSMIAMRALGSRGGGCFPLGSGNDELRHGDAVLPSPLHLLLIRETAAVSPALLGRPATASAVLAGVAFLRAGGCGRTRQRDPGAGHDLLHDEQPGQKPSRTSCAEHRHRPTRSKAGLQGIELTAAALRVRLDLVRTVRLR